MKATGIVRRIDGLGRVVVPKEIRRILGIRDRTPLEIFTGDDGEVIFKKYSPIADLSVCSEQFAEVLHNTSGDIAIICDKDKVIAAFGVPQKELVERRISPALAEQMERRTSFPLEGSTAALLPIEGMGYQMIAGAPIVAMNDVCGYVMLVSEQAENATDAGTKLVCAAASLLGMQIDY